MIYFLRAVDGGPVKIGHSENVKRRIKALEKHYEKPLVLLAQIQGDITTERAIHERFAHLRIGLTEQFQPDADLLNFINRPLFAVTGEVEEMPVKENERDSVIAVKCRQEYKDWLVRFGKKTRYPIPNLIDYALMIFAKSDGFPDPPER